MSRDTGLYLSDILRCCEKIQRYVAGLSRAEFDADERTTDAVLRNLEILGEAAKKLPPEIRAAMPEIPWPKIAGMRDWLAHVYFNVDSDIVWDVLQSKLPELQRAVQGFCESQAKDIERF